MPVLRQGVDANGRPVFVRAPYKPEAYSVPEGWIESVKQDWGQYSPEELIADPGGPFGGMAKLRLVERDGKSYQLITAGGANEFAIEVELGRSCPYSCVEAVFLGTPKGRESFQVATPRSSSREATNTIPSTRRYRFRDPDARRLPA